MEKVRNSSRIEKQGTYIAGLTCIYLFFSFLILFRYSFLLSEASHLFSFWISLVLPHSILFITLSDILYFYSLPKTVFLQLLPYFSLSIHSLNLEELSLIMVSIPSPFMDYPVTVNAFTFSLLKDLIIAQSISLLKVFYRKSYMCMCLK